MNDEFEKFKNEQYQRMDQIREDHLNSIRKLSSDEIKISSERLKNKCIQQSDQLHAEMKMWFGALVCQSPGFDDFMSAVSILGPMHHEMVRDIVLNIVNSDEGHHESDLIEFVFTMALYVGFISMLQMGTDHTLEEINKRGSEDD